MRFTMAAFEAVCLNMRCPKPNTLSSRLRISRQTFHTGSRRCSPDSKPHDGPPPNDEAHFEVDLETKTVNTVVGPLPLSPLMDPSFYEARQKFTKPKAAESSTTEKTKFRRLLERNPYGRLPLSSVSAQGKQATNTSHSPRPGNPPKKMHRHQDSPPKLLPPPIPARRPSHHLRALVRPPGSAPLPKETATTSRRSHLQPRNPRNPTTSPPQAPETPHRPKRLPPRPPGPPPRTRHTRHPPLPSPPRPPAPRHPPHSRLRKGPQPSRVARGHGVLPARDHAPSGRRGPPLLRRARRAEGEEVHRAVRELGRGEGAQAPRVLAGSG